MKRQVIVAPEAEQEMAGAIGWYEDRVTGLGHEFLLSIDSVFDAISKSPLHFPVVHRNIRRALMRRFPYEVFFVLQNGRAIILAVHHARRDPQKWRQRADGF